MREALAAAAESAAAAEVPVGAFVIHDGRVIARAALCQQRAALREELRVKCREEVERVTAYHLD